MKNNRNNKNARSLDLNKKSISTLNSKEVNGGVAQCSILVPETDLCRSKIAYCPPPPPPPNE